MPFWYVDYYYVVLVIPAVLLGLWAQYRVTSTFNRYNRIASQRGYTAAQVARSILDENGLYQVQIERVSGNLTDHFDPRSNVVRLSDSVYGNSSLGAIGVAAHEVGHAVQYAQNYVPIKLRNAFVPIANIGSTISIPLILLGLFLYEPLVMVGIVLYGAVAVFQLLTLPVEFNASRRAIATLESHQILYDDEITGAKKVLSAAALTYVAALITSLAQLLRLFLLYGRRRDD